MLGVDVDEGGFAAVRVFEFEGCGRAAGFRVSFVVLAGWKRGGPVGVGIESWRFVLEAVDEKGIFGEVWEGDLERTDA